MYVSESTFLHLHQAADERQSRDLEYRRIARERETDSGSATARAFAGLVNRFRRSEPAAQRRFSHP